MTWGGKRLKTPQWEEARVLAPGSGRWRVTSRVAGRVEPLRPLRCSPHCPDWTATVTRSIADGGLPGPRTTARVTVPLTPRPLTLGKAAALAGESEGGGRGRTQAVRAPEMRRKTLLESPSPLCVSARCNGAGRTRRRRTGGPASRRTRRTGASVLRGPPEDGVPTVRRKAPGRTPHACSWRRLPRLRGFTYTSLQLWAPWCCHRVLRDPEALGGRLRH